MSKISNISANTSIRGRISADGDIDVFGQVEGAIKANGEVTIAAGALIKSTVEGRRVSVSGAVAGDVSASESLVLEPGSRVVGDLVAPTIGVRPGALLRGKVETGSDPAPARPRAATRAATQTTARATAKSASTASEKSAAKSAPKKKKSSRRAPAPVIPQASGRGKKAAATKKKRASAPKPQVKALKKRTKKTSKRRAKAR